MSKSGGGGTQTTTQQNLPDWAMDYAKDTLNLGNQFSMFPGRPTTLDRDYSGLRGYNSTGQTATAVPQTPGTGLNFQGGMGRQGSGSQPGIGIADQVGANVMENDAQREELLAQRAGNGTMQSPQGFRGRPGTGLKFADGQTASMDHLKPPPATNASESTENQTETFEPPKWGDYLVPFDAEGPGNPWKNPDTWWQHNEAFQPGGKYYKDVAGKNFSTSTNGESGESSSTPTGFQAFDRQRFAAPSQNTLRGEGILAGRYDQRFGESGTDPFAAANAAVGAAANYTSGFQGTTGEGQIGGQAGNYQTNLANASNPGVFQSGDYTAGLPNYANPNANQTNVNAAMGNVNAGLQATTFSNANAGLKGPQNYNQNFQNLVNQSMNPYQDQVVNQTISDLDRARRMTQNEIGGQAAKAGAFGGSRQALLEAENNRNFADRTAAAVGQLRQQGFESAANRASQENLQRLGLTAQDLQQTRGLASQGNLAAQGLTARDAQDVRGLQSQGALAAQGLQSQGGLAAQGLQSQGNLAALNANAGLYQSALGLNAAGDRSAMGYNAGLLSDAMRLDASDLNQRRNLASNEAQFAETANRGAGALNLQGGTALGNLAQAGTADERQRIADMLASGQAQQGRDQQDLDFIFSEFNRELDYPGRMIDLRNAAISPATGSIVTTTQPRYQQNPILGGAGAGLAAYGMTGNPYIAGGAALLSLLS